MTELGNVARREPAPALKITDLVIETEADGVTIELLHGVSLSVPAGECVGIVGESGAGKSVMMSAALGLCELSGTRVTSGSIEVGGVEIVGASARVLNKVRGNVAAIVFQEPSVSLDPSFTIGAQIAEPVRWHRRVSRQEAWDRAIEALRLAGFPNPERRAKDYPHMLSGGLKQRAMIALAISCEPQLLIADEATTALDVTIQAQVLDLLAELRERLDMSMVLVTHDLGVVAQTCSEVSVMYAGEIVEAGRTSDVFAAPAHPYTEGLLRCVPDRLDREAALVGIPGDVPAAGSRVDGCRFAARCSYAEQRCKVEAPELQAIEEGRTVRCHRFGEVDLEGVT
ncbi:MAG: ABC transporter ATP-binding protein [Actinomycetota bacterium]|nr:ABC transporter ATP-binding protein [Actinomycetota bacterium]